MPTRNRFPLASFVVALTRVVTRLTVSRSLMVCLSITATLLGTIPGFAVSGEPRVISVAPRLPIPDAVVIDDVVTVHTTQVLPTGVDGRVASVGNVEGQIELAFGNLDSVLKESGSGLASLVKLNVYVANDGVAERIREQFSNRFAGALKPAVTFVSGHLANADALLAFDAVAIVSSADTTKLATGDTNSVPVKLNAASQGSNNRQATSALMPAGGRVYISGQAERGDLATATRGTLDSLKRSLEFLGLSTRHVVSLKAFTMPMSDAGVATVRDEFSKFFGENLVPPLSLVEWKSSATTPIEIELVAWGGPAKEGVSIEYLTPAGMSASPVFSRIARVHRGPTIYVSGLYGTEAGAEGQIRGIFSRLDQTLKEAGGDLKHMAKATYYVAADDVSKRLNELRPEYYDPQRPPAASKAVVPGTGLANRTITLDMIAVPRTP